jgi:hypothetical protein
LPEAPVEAVLTQFVPALLKTLKLCDDNVVSPVSWQFVFKATAAHTVVDPSLTK